MICNSCSVEALLLTVTVFEDDSKKKIIKDTQQVCDTCLASFQHVGVVEIEIRNVKDLARPQVQAIVDKAELKGKGTFKLPELNLEAIRARADELDPKSQLKADLYLLMMEVEKLNAKIALLETPTDG